MRAYEGAKLRERASVAAAHARAALVAREIRMGLSPAPQRQFYQQGEADVDGLSAPGFALPLT
jgi:hypothetical protein